MKGLRSIARRKRGVSPIIAEILMVAITVVLAGVLYVMVSGLMSSPGGGPRIMGVLVSKTQDGTKWVLHIDTVPSGLKNSTTYLITRDTGGRIMCHKTPLKDLPENETYINTGTEGIVVPGDYILLKIPPYEAGCTYEITDDAGILATGELRV